MSGIRPHRSPAVMLTRLPRAAPAAVGVDSAGVLAFLDAVAADGLELHGLMVWRAGAVAVEGFWQPYAADRPHMLHSAVKSWTAAAVGLAVGDGLLHLQDRVVGFFPRHCPEVVGDNLAAMTVQDLLTMRSGHRTGISGGEWRGIDDSWVAAFLREPVPDRPGTAFIYSSASSYMLSAIVTQVTGRTVHDLLAERVFRPLGMTQGAWDLSPEGYSTGGNGLSCTLEDVLTFGVLHLRRGMWDGVQILPADWVDQATSNHVDDVWMAPLDGRRYPARDSMDAAAVERREGYGYHWWMTPWGGARASGLFGQHCILLPAQDAVVAITAALGPGETRLMPHVGRHLVPALGGGRPDPVADDRLLRRLATLALPTPTGVPVSRIEAAIGDKPFRMEPNEDGVEEVRFVFADGQCRLLLRDARGTHQVDAGMAAPVDGETSMTGARLHHAYQPETMRVVASGTWLDPLCLCLTWRFVETAFCDTLLCRFSGGTLRLDRRVNTNPGGMERPTLTGHLA